MASLGLGESAANAFLVGRLQEAYERNMSFNLAQGGDRGRPAAVTPAEAVEWDGGLSQIHPPNPKRPRLNDRKACSSITTIQECDRHRPRCWLREHNDSGCDDVACNGNGVLYSYLSLAAVEDAGAMVPIRWRNTRQRRMEMLQLFSTDAL